MKKGKGLLGSPRATQRKGGVSGGAKSLVSGPGRFAKRVKPNKSGK